MRAVQQSLDGLGTPLIDVEFAVLDLETTGGSPATDRITEVGVVKVRSGEITGTLHALVNPGVSIPPMITALTGISNAMVANEEPIEVVLPCLLEFLGDAVLVAHNASFDVRFLQAALRAHAYPRLESRVVCTARLARVLLPRDEVPNVKLATLARYLRAGTQPCHRAFTDAKATVDVLHALLERAAGFGVLALNDLLTFPTIRTQQRHNYRKVHLADELPRAPGVYLFRGRNNEVLYVGKAGKDLRGRVRSYFSGDGRATSSSRASAGRGSRSSASRSMTAPATSARSPAPPRRSWPRTRSRMPYRCGAARRPSALASEFPPACCWSCAAAQARALARPMPNSTLAMWRRWRAASMAATQCCCWRHSWRRCAASPLSDATSRRL